MARLLDLLSRNLRALGILAITVAAVTWWMDIAGLVHQCVYCRTQRTAIGVVGLLMVMPDPRAWWLRYPAAAVCFLGASVAVDQIFLVIRNLSAGKESNPVNLVLATGALFVLIGQALLIFMKQRGAPAEKAP
jgi:hypothetical protein